MAMPQTLAQWLDYQQRVHPHEIELGLARVREVWQRLGAPRPAPLVITVGGTNGKGSTLAFLDAMLRGAGVRTGVYTSPHLLRYNERVRVAGREADDAVLVRAFERIEAARGAIPLTWFEFGTLAAILVFAEAACDVALLEVGLGGRLDAVNIIDADAAIVTTIGLDHQDWLGSDLDTIGGEKAGIFRRDRPAIIGDAHAPRGLLDAAGACAAQVFLAGRDFAMTPQLDSWLWSSRPGRGDDAQAVADSVLVPEPALSAACQIDNAAAAIAALHALRERIAWNPRAIAQGVGSAQASGRMQRFALGPDAAELVIDVAHNPQAATVLAQWLDAHPVAGRNLAVFSALGDKDIAGMLGILAPRFDQWHIAGLDADSPRGLSAAALATLIEPLLDGGAVLRHADIDAALRGAMAVARRGDRIVAFGSFFVVAVALRVASAL